MGDRYITKQEFFVCESLSLSGPGSGEIDHFQSWSGTGLAWEDESSSDPINLNYMLSPSTMTEHCQDGSVRPMTEHCQDSSVRPFPGRCQGFVCLFVCFLLCYCFCLNFFCILGPWVGMNDRIPRKDPEGRLKP